MPDDVRSDLYFCTMIDDCIDWLPVNIGLYLVYAMLLMVSICLFLHAWDAFTSSYCRIWAWEEFD